MSQSEAISLVNVSGGFHGFMNLLRKENSLWWGTRKWWMQILIWLLISNGLIALMLWVTPATESAEAVPPLPTDSANPVPLYAEMMTVFLLSHGAFASIGVMILAQSAIVGEKRSGTAEWILSNPVSRSAVILSKLYGNALGILAILVVVQSTVAYLQISLRSAELVPLLPYLAGTGLLSLTLLFYLALALMLGTFFNGRGPVIGISIGILVVQNILRQLLAIRAPWLSLVLPDTVLQLASPLVQGQALPVEWPIPIISTVFMSIVFVLIAIWRFNREEF